MTSQRCSDFSEAPPADCSFDQLADYYVEALRDGDAPELEELARRYANLADDIRRDFPVIALSEGLRPRSSLLIEVPETLAGCEIVREIGRGGMGAVYEARHPKLSRRTAIKVITGHGSSQKRLEERFQREAEAASRLIHPNIVPCFDFGQEDGLRYISMMYVEGQSLRDILEDVWRCDGVSAGTSPAPITSDFAMMAAVGADIASALAHAHDMGTIHRDIKPANLILDNNGKVWVTDFGLAKLRDEDSDLSKTGDMIGTPRYMAPEQIRGNADERSDIYGLGVTLWELATGKRAWDAINQGDIISVKTSIELPEVLEMNPNVPAGLAGIIDKACAFDPDERYQTAKELQHVLNRFAHGEKVGDRRSRSRDRQNRPWLRRRFLVAALMTAIMFGALLMRWSEQPREKEPVIRPIAVAAVETAPGEYRIDENEVSVAVVAFEFRNGVLTGDDAALFELDHQSGEVRFRDKPNFENPRDVGHDNNYELSLKSTSTPDAERSLTVSVKDVDEPLILGSVPDPSDHHILIRKGCYSIDLHTELGVQDPEGVAGSIVIKGGRDAELFQVAANYGLIPKDDLPPRSQPYEVIVDLCDQPTGRNAVLVKSDGKLAMAVGNDVGPIWQGLTILDSTPVCDLTRNSANDWLMLLSTEAEVHLWKVVVDDDLNVDYGTGPLTVDCGLPDGTEAIATRNGTDFIVFGRDAPRSKWKDSDSKRMCWQAHLVSDNRFELIGDPREIEVPAAKIHGAYFPSENLIGLLCTRPDKQKIECVIDVDTLQIRYATYNFSEMICGTSVAPNDLTACNRSEVRLLITVSSVPFTSGQGTGEKTFTIQNNSGETLQLNWVAEKKVEYGILLPGAAMTQHSFVGHVWELNTSTGALWDAFEVREENDNIVISERFKLMRETSADVEPK